MRVRLLRDWKGYRAGKEFEPQAGAGQILIRRGIAALIECEDDKETRGQGDKAKKRKRS